MIEDVSEILHSLRHGVTSGCKEGACRRCIPFSLHVANLGQGFSKSHGKGHVMNGGRRNSAMTRAGGSEVDGGGRGIAESRCVYS